MAGLRGLLFGIRIPKAHGTVAKLLAVKICRFPRARSSASAATTLLPCAIGLDLSAQFQALCRRQSWATVPHALGYLDCAAPRLFACRLCEQSQGATCRSR